MATNYERGRRAERKCIKDLEELRFTCIRSAGSKGPIDVSCWDINRHKLIQVKSVSSKAGSIPSYIKELQRLTDLKRSVPVGTAIEFWVLRGTKWVNKITL